MVHSSSDTDSAAIKPLGQEGWLRAQHPIRHTRAQHVKNSYVHPQNEQLQRADKVLRHTA